MFQADLIFWLGILFALGLIAVIIWAALFGHSGEDMVTASVTLDFISQQLTDRETGRETLVENIDEAKTGIPEEKSIIKLLDEEINQDMAELRALYVSILKEADKIGFPDNPASDELTDLAVNYTEILNEAEIKRNRVQEAMDRLKRFEQQRAYYSQMLAAFDHFCRYHPENETSKPSIS